MIRLLLFFVLLAAIAYGATYLVGHPGHISLDWFGWQIETSAALLVIAIAVAAIVAWVILRIVFGLPGFLGTAVRQRRRENGYEALSRGLVAVNAGDARAAGRASAQASRYLKDDGLALMLRAQAAHVSGDTRGAIEAYEALAQRDETRILGLRGLHAEASLRGDDEAARHFAAAAHRASPLPWSSQAMLQRHASDSDWEAALRTVESGLAARHIDKETGERQRAVLETAIGYDKEMSEPEAALAHARAAIKRAPDLAPAVVLATRLLSRQGDIRKASKLVEKAWPNCRHPDLAEAYLDVRPGDSTTDRLGRARTLMGIASFDPVSRLIVARAALASTEYEAARSAMEPFVGEGKRPTVRMCLLMAELEEAEHGDYGQWREWLARASRAPLDPAWVADGIVYEQWGPVSPTTGKLDAFRWQVPAERMGPALDALPPRRDPALSRGETGSSSAAMLEHSAPDPVPAGPRDATSAEVADPAPEASGDAPAPAAVTAPAPVAATVLPAEPASPLLDAPRSDASLAADRAPRHPSVYTSG